MQKCGWTHCSCGGYIYDNQPKIRVGKKWYHEECAKDRELIQDIITKFIEQVNDAQIPVLRKIVNDIIYNEIKPAEYVMFALDYAIAHPEMKLTYPQGLYRICNAHDVLKAWTHKVAKEKVGSHKIDINEVEQPTTVINKKTNKRMVSDLFD